MMYFYMGGVYPFCRLWQTTARDIKTPLSTVPLVVERRHCGFHRNPSSNRHIVIASQCVHWRGNLLPPFERFFDDRRYCVQPFPVPRGMKNPFSPSVIARIARKPWQSSARKTDKIQILGGRKWKVSYLKSFSACCW